MKKTTILMIAAICVQPILWFFIWFLLWDATKAKMLEDGLSAACIGSCIISVIALTVLLTPKPD